MTPAPLIKEMALTAEDFVRLLPGAAGDLPWRQEGGGRFRIGGEDGGVDIALEPLPPRRIALITLPVMRVTLSFRGWAADEVRGFVQRFDRAFQRGGG